ncbi:DEAD/DEAH box helicase [Desulforhabdus sp. TSK]|uniref:DEAD/DEAH box helicase n=1 Tax=Desulforhabdus sp. TSK TaxID=2925014 RepID=UPI001FC8E7BC|nr:AAA domain-containing protein [Desulforhabdus sp. TSK]GKT08958.1 hypothetical protein DSTSK_22630 [Desulforhabdus sp. TSK]
MGDTCDQELRLGGRYAPFGPHQWESLKGRIDALLSNAVSLHTTKTRLFPANLSTAFFVHVLKDPLSAEPRVLGFRAVHESGETVDGACWSILNAGESASVRNAFSDRLLTVWERAVQGGKGPHLFHFGEYTRRELHKWGEGTGPHNRLAFLRDTGSLHFTDLRRLLLQHFHLPAPGRLTLFALAQLLGLMPSVPDSQDVSVLPGAPESLLHPDLEPYFPQDEWERDATLRNRAAQSIQTFLALQERIWQWTRPHLQSDWKKTEWEAGPAGNRSTGMHYLNFLEEERRLREEDILSLQKYSLQERVERFRAMGPLSFHGTRLDPEGRFLYEFQMETESGLSKFREGDFLKLSPVGAPDLQAGFPVILADYHPQDGKLSLLSRQGRMPLNRRSAYSLEEDLTDWNHPKLMHAVKTLFSPQSSGGMGHSLSRLLTGSADEEQDGESLRWVRDWMTRFEPVSRLNPAQQAALELPFRKRVGLIQGPPGTGKSYLLAWIVIALILQARDAGRPLRIAVCALTHQAIDGVLHKLVQLVSRHQVEGFHAKVMKFGRWEAEETDDAMHGEGLDGRIVEPGIRVEPLNRSEELSQCRHLVLGSTGFGLYNLLQGKIGEFQPFFDWIVFDEASQVLVPQALLSLIHGKGNVLFLGDAKQLPPIVLGRYEKPAAPTVKTRQHDDLAEFCLEHSEHVGEEKCKEVPGDASSAALGSEGASARFSPDVSQSILGFLLERYGPEHRVLLDRTYRMNAELCAFPSRTWYAGALQSDPGNAASRLRLDFPAGSTHPLGTEDRPGDLIHRILDPEKPVVLVLADHRGQHQQSDREVEIMTRLAHRLMTVHGVSPDRLALISPHRAQNNAMTCRLVKLLGDEGISLPVIDTVERLQGAERDVVLFSITTSDPDHVTSEFLNNPHRFNVAITRARHKLIVVGSKTFFLAVPQNEEALTANTCFKQFLHYCLDRESLVVWKDPPICGPTKSG